VNTEYAVGNIRIRFESRARRRWFVALFYCALAMFDLVAFSNSAKFTTSAWVSVGCMIVFAALFIVFTGIAGDIRTRGDEREMHRRDNAHFRAYYFPGYILIGALFASYFKAPNPITPLTPLGVRSFLAQLPTFLTMTAFLLYLTLPQAILLWTEPDMEEPQQAN
jgi:uncharacterized membrane protein